MKPITESQVIAKIRMNLTIYCPEVIHVDRIQSGVAMRGPYHIRLAQAGTPDLYALLNCDGGHTVFIEAKRPRQPGDSGGRQSDDQKRFQQMIAGMKHIHYVLATSVGEVVQYIQREITGDPLKQKEG